MKNSDFENVIGLINEPESRIRAIISSLERNLLGQDYLDELLKYSIKNRNLYKFWKSLANISMNTNHFNGVVSYLESAGEFYISGVNERYSINLELLAGLNNLADRLYGCCIYELAAKISILNGQGSRGVDNYLKAQNIATSMGEFLVADNYGKIIKALLNDENWKE